MKKILVILVALLLGSFAYAQPFELGFVAGTSLNRSCQVDAGADIAWMYSTEHRIDFGIGTGLRYARPMHRINRDAAGPVTRDYSNELGVPVFGRLRYWFSEEFFAQAEVGIAVGNDWDLSVYKRKPYISAYDI